MRAEEVHNETATKAIQAICDLLWYIDGSQATLSERGCGVPDFVQKFFGYNRPEQHKQQKRLTHSLSKEVLFSHSRCIFGIFHGAFWDQPMWAKFKQSVEVFACSISEHADLLIMKRIQMEAVHSSPDVVQSIRDVFNMRYTGVHAVRPPFLMSMSNVVTALGINVPLELRTFLPTDR